MAGVGDWVGVAAGEWLGAAFGSGHERGREMGKGLEVATLEMGFVWSF